MGDIRSAQQRNAWAAIAVGAVVLLAAAGFGLPAQQPAELLAAFDAAAKAYVEADASERAARAAAASTKPRL